MAQAVHIVPVEAASTEDEPRDETQILWLELEVPATSPWCEKDLVCAGRGEPRPPEWGFAFTDH